MRKLKLQMHVSLNGMTADQKGANFNWDDELRAFSIANMEGVDRLIIGRRTAKDLIPHWAGVAARPDDPDYGVGKGITDIPKIVFSNTLDKSIWPNTQLVKGDLVEEINKLKKQPGKDMLVYGGTGFVSSLIKEGLIDQYYLLVNPVALEGEESIFQSLRSRLALTLVESRQFRSGTVLLVYEPKRG